MEWKPIATAPFDRDLELAVITYDGVYALASPCRRILGSWIDAETKKRVDVQPTHWRAEQRHANSHRVVHTFSSRNDGFQVASRDFGVAIGEDGVGPYSESLGLLLRLHT